MRNVSPRPHPIEATPGEGEAGFQDFKDEGKEHLMPDKNFVISYKLTGSKIYTGFYVIAAPRVDGAIAKARSMWVEHWNLSFPHKPDGEDEVKRMEFIAT